MDVHEWMTTDLGGVRTKLFDSVASLVPRERWHEQADDGGSTITHLLLHVARHHDLAVNTVIRGREPLFDVHRDALGLTDGPAGVGLPEREDRFFSALVTPSMLMAYVTEVFDTTANWLAPLGSLVLDSVPNAAHRLTRHGGLDAEELPWLYGMWADKPIWWLMQWPVIGHGNAHVGEGISVRNRMGLSPF